MTWKVKSAGIAPFCSAAPPGTLRTEVEILRKKKKGSTERQGDGRNSVGSNWISSGMEAQRGSLIAAVSACALTRKDFLIFYFCFKRLLLYAEGKASRSRTPCLCNTPLTNIDDSNSDFYISLLCFGLFSFLTATLCKGSNRGQTEHFGQLLCAPTVPPVPLISRCNDGGDSLLNHKHSSLTVFQEPRPSADDIPQRLATQLTLKKRKGRDVGGAEEN